MEINSFGEQIDGQEIKNLEIQMGLEIPLEYNLFLLKYNGGKLEPSGLILYINNEKLLIEVGYLLGIQPDIYYRDLFTIFTETILDLPANLFVFSCCEGRAYFCIDRKEEDKVFYIEILEQFESEKALIRKSYVSNSFNDFLNYTQFVDYYDMLDKL